MRKIITYLLVLLCTGVMAQRSGQDSISVKTAILRFTPFTTTEMNALGRVNQDVEAGVIYNSTTETLWAWDGYTWKNLGLAPIEGGITIDQVIDITSTNPVENQAIGNRFLQTVDEAPDSPFNDIEMWFGTKAEYAGAAKDNPRRIFVITDSIPTMPDSPMLIDGKVVDVNLVNNALVFTGEGGAVNKTVDLSGLSVEVTGSDLDQQIETFEFTSEFGFTVELKLTNVPSRFLDMSRFFQDASEVEIDDTDLPVLADDVQEAMDKMYENGDYLKLWFVNAIPIDDNDSQNLEQPINILSPAGQAVVNYARQGNILYYYGTFNVIISQGIGENHFAAWELNLTDITNDFDLADNGIDYYPAQVSISEESELAARGLIVDPEIYAVRLDSDPDKANLSGSIFIFPAPKGIIDQGSFQLDRISGGGYRRDWVPDAEFPSITINFSGFVPIDKL